MAKPPATFAQQLIDAVTGNSKATPDQIIKARFFPERRGSSINPSIPARYNRKTGKIILMDLAQHSAEVARLMEKGVIPLRKGYLYIDDQAFKTLTETGVLDSNLNFKDSAKQFGSVVSAGKKLIAVNKSELARDLKKLRDEDPYVLAFKRKQPTNIIFAPKVNSKPSLNEVIDLVEAYVDNNTLTHSKKQYVNIFVYYSSEKTFRPSSNSFLFIIPITSLLITDQLINIPITKDTLAVGSIEVFTSENYDEFQKVRRDLPDSTAAGHLKAVRTKDVETLLIEAKKLHDAPEVQGYAEIMGILEEAIAILESDLAELQALDRFFSTPAAYFHPDLRVHFENLVSGANQLGMGINFNTITKKGLKGSKADAFIESLYTIEGVSTPESDLINSTFKGARTGVVLDRISRIWSVAAERFAVRLAKERAELDPFMESSHSLVQAALISALGDIFEVNTKRKINLSKRKEAFIRINNLYKNSKDIKFRIPKKQSGKIKFKDTYSKSSVSAKRNIQQFENILPIINANIKKYVLAEMTYPSLENRSGRFADSVRVLSAQENAAIKYTYLKSPYQVFSTSRGRRPWATKERDPARIIDNAIKKIGMDKFNKVFRTEEV